jgi:hypothetical protein
VDLDCGAESVLGDVLDLRNLPTVLIECVQVVALLEVLVEVVVLQLGRVFPQH